MEYSGLWLDHKPEGAVLPDIGAVYYNSSARVVLTAARELRDALSAMGAAAPELRLSAFAPERGVYLFEGGGGAYTDKDAQAYEIEERDGLIRISSETAQGVLWGAFELIRMIRCRMPIEGISKRFAPDMPLRMLDHWDNTDGSIERGYSGRSFLFKDGEIIINERTRCYARLLASVGINAIVINNVNVDDNAVRFITGRYFDSLGKLSEVFAGYGIKLFISADYAAPIDIGGMDTADPCDKRVAEWWENTAAEIYKALPELGGFLIKADSEGRPGPFTYGRDQAEGANVLARALKPYGGIVIWRCFVYNCHQDWRDRKTDRARAGYDYFKPLDGRFDDNVILQIKNGPVDFQVREPVSPLFGAMPATNQMLEVQIAQEYTGQQRDLCYLIPWFKEILDFKMRLNAENDTVADYISGRACGNKLCGIAAVCNTGGDYNWTGHDLAAANLYGFGRLSFDTSLSAERIAGEWIMQTFGGDEKTLEVVSDMLLSSWHTYEKYTAPLGVGWMVAQSDHYGPDVDAFEYSRWGTYHYSDRNGLGVDRTDGGTGYIRQYSEPLAELYGNTETCPDELLLFFHHVPYTHVLKSGETVIQHIYNTHFEGAEDVKRFIDAWSSLEGRIDRGAFERVSERLSMQLENAEEWRDIINTYFYRKSGIADDKGRKIYK